jgi:hypothetical protein
MPESTAMLLLDVEREFESVWHEALMHKLFMKGSDIFLAQLIFSFLKNRSFQVCVLVKHSHPPAIFPTVYLRVPYLLPYIIFLLPTLESVNWPHLPTTLLFLCLTRFWRWFAANCHSF